MISKDKVYRTRDGREVRIYATDGGDNYAVHGAYKLNDKWYIASWCDDGRFDAKYTCAGDTDLIEVRPRIQREVWVNVYRHCSHAFPDRAFADRNATAERIACVKLVIDVEEGDGL